MITVNIQRWNPSADAKREIDEFLSGVFDNPTSNAKREIDEFAQLSGHPFAKITVDCEQISSDGH